MRKDNIEKIKKLIELTPLNFRDAQRAAVLEIIIAIFYYEQDKT